MISIITICYNSEKTIKRTIQSILNQTTNQFEHVFIDGSSKDKTVATIEEFHDDYVKKGVDFTLISEKDKGISNAINKGIRLAKGDIIGILNSDDWYEANTVFLVQKAFDEHPGIDIVMGSGYIHNKDHIIVKRPKKGLIITSRNFNHPAMFVRKECYEDVGGYNEQKPFEDFDWYLRALRKGKNVLFIQDILSNFSVGGISTQKSFSQTLKKIKLRYATYRDNGYSRIYIFECIFHELAKYCLIRK